MLEGFRFISNFATHAGPLYRLITKERKFKISQEDRKALDYMKKLLIEATLLVHFDPTRKIKMAVDASNVSVRGILMQEDNKGDPPEELKWTPISYFSQLLKKHQVNYTTTEKETLAIIVGVRKFKHYLEGKKFIVESDHHALCQLHKSHFKLGRLHRWAIELSEFEYEVQYLSGEKHPADCFSRYRNEWSHRNAIIEDDELDYLEATPIKHEEKVRRVTQDIGFRELTTEWYTRYAISPKWVDEQVRIVRFVTEQDFKIEDMQQKDSYCGQIMKVLETHQPEKEYKLLEKRFVINK